MLEKLRKFVKKEVVFCISALCAILTMFLVPPNAAYIEYIDFRVLCLLFSLMAVVAGMKSVGVFKWLTYQLLSRIKNGRILGVTLVMLPFFASMFITNDVALIVFVPFTLGLLSELGYNKSVVSIIVLQTVGANLGSMATPVGNPQNLFLYSTYNLEIGEFLSVVLPLTILSFVALFVFTVPILPKALPDAQIKSVKITNNIHLTVFAVLFIICLLTVLRIVPYQATAIVIIIVMFILNRRLFKEIDYILLLTFVCFFIISENLGQTEVIRSFLQQLLNKNALLTSIATSQIISNVPAAVLLSGFTDNWKALLQGVNIGGLGTPIASLASLITLKLYMANKDARITKFLGIFTLANVIGLIILILFTLVI